MAIIKAVNSKANIGQAVNYVVNKEKTQGMVSGKDCNPRTAIDEMKATKEYWGKMKGRQYKHYVQSFDPKDNITPEMAHEIGKKFMENAKEFEGFEVVMGTHIDKGHIHNHFIVNSVNFKNGKKYQESERDLERLKNFSNELSLEHGLSVPTKGAQPTAFDMKKYKALEKGFEEKGKSYLLDTAKDVFQSLKKATGKDEFINLMNKKGYEVNWRDNGKNITFQNPDGKKIRSSNLEKTFKDPKFSKEGMMNEFELKRLDALNKEKDTQKTAFTEKQKKDKELYEEKQRKDKEFKNLEMLDSLNKQEVTTNATNESRSNDRASGRTGTENEPIKISDDTRAGLLKDGYILSDDGKSVFAVTDWGSFETALRNDENRIPKQPSHEITRDIQQQVRDAQTRTDGATHEHSEPDQLDREQQPDIREDIEKGNGKPLQRDELDDWELER